jgi:curved DNA-binding protein CbpA
MPRMRLRNCIFRNKTAGKAPAPRGDIPCGFVSPYKILQVDRGAEPEVIDAAYRRLVAKYHPDRNPTPDATARLRDLNAAYAILRDPVRRAEYDRPWREAWSGASATHRHAGDGSEDVASHGLRNALLVGAFLTLLVLRPEVGASLAGLSALVWLAWRFPARTSTLLKAGAVLVVVTVLAFGISYWLRERRASEELKGMDLQTLFAAKLREQVTQCARAAPTRPELVAAYCACLADATRARLDASPVHVDSAADFRRAVAARFRPATPSDEDKARCLAPKARAP